MVPVGGLQQQNVYQIAKKLVKMTLLIELTLLYKMGVNLDWRVQATWMVQKTGLTKHSADLFSCPQHHDANVR